jgi:hypothetical protein
MLKFILAARRKREDTQARYFYEWGNIHVALMLANPVVFQLFQRYAQHFSISGVAAADLPLPFSAMEWDNMADHWLNSREDLLRALKDPEYVVRMQPHKFGDSAFQVVLMAGAEIHRQADFASGGGVKLLLWGAAPAGATQESTAAQWQAAVHRPLLASTASRTVRKYVHNTPRGVDAQMFAGTLFARGDLNAFAFLDELWFDSLEDIYALMRDPATREIFVSGAALLDQEKSFSMVVTERIVADFVTSNEMTPRPAVLTPGTLEARVAAQGGEGWNIPKPSHRHRA